MPRLIVAATTDHRDMVQKPLQVCNIDCNTVIKERLGKRALYHLQRQTLQHSQSLDKNARKILLTTSGIVFLIRLISSPGSL